jgi:hypothetical protein
MKQSDCTSSFNRDRADKKVDKVFVISQVMGDNIFHFLSENLPRLAPFLPELIAEPDIKIHLVMENNKAKQFAINWLGFLGITADRLVGGKIEAKEVFIPEGGGCGA